jgi:biopolymer transport protein ExbD
MAFRPSKRSSRTVEPIELNMFPMMNLMVVLVPLLLSTATIIKIGVIELNLPQAVGGEISETAIPKEAQRSLDLTVTITDGGFYLSSSQAIIKQEKTGGPTIEKTAEGEYDYSQLSDKLLEVKRRIVGSPLDTKRIIIQAESDIEYQILVSTMDAARSIIVDETRVELFPDVSISAGVL